MSFDMFERLKELLEEYPTLNYKEMEELMVLSNYLNSEISGILYEDTY